MGQTIPVWLVVLVSLLAANLPFMNARFMVVFRLKEAKSFGLRLLELVLWYFIAGAFALWLEHRGGQIAPQGWEFYAITGTLFITFAFPGFVYRYLFKLR
ncbi:MAG: DUF2818 family protein [Polaromonas sp.]|jgi:hypothetical protein|nr:DUF2818 family protein [Polaromonas sp.]